MAYTTIDKPTDYFNTKLTTGTGSSQAVTGLGFQPDWIWGKRRDSTGHPTLFDSVRGITKGLESSSSGAEFTSTDYYSSFDSDGFTIASGSSGAGNGSGQTAVQWCWLASNTTASNTDGSITSTVSASTTAGFSISTYTGTGSAGTIGHGLGSTPKMMIVKCRSNADTWAVYHVDVGATKYMELDTTVGSQTSTQPWNDTEPTSSLFTVGDWSATNGSGRTYVAYCFAEKKGYSKFGSYTGNGSSSDGTFVFTGFRPAWIMIKRSNASGHDWVLIDNKRLGYNPDNNTLLPNTSTAEDTGNRIDILSNGFKNYNANGSENESGGEYIYMAFAESPFVTSTGIPTTAR
jgi:hypothetical protein